MAKRFKKPRDVNQLTAAIVRESTEGSERQNAEPVKNPAAVELGRLGGLKGGKARAEKLSPNKRSEIAKRAAAARWAARQ